MILDGFDIYRLDTRRLIPMPMYRPVDEIFQFHNLLALRRDLLSLNLENTRMRYD